MCSLQVWCIRIFDFNTTVPELTQLVSHLNKFAGVKKKDINVKRMCS